jgi:hypothetical protein
MPITRTPIIDDSGDGRSGTVIDNAWKQELYDQIDGTTGTAGWTPYTVSWRTDGGWPTVGNGVLSGRYAIVGKTCHVAIITGFGSTTGIGTGGMYQWTVPFTARLVPGVAAQQNIWPVGMLGAGGAAQPPALGYGLSADLIYVLTSVGGLVGPTSPFTWGAGMLITIRGAYELP